MFERSPSSPRRSPLRARVLAGLVAVLLPLAAVAGCSDSGTSPSEDIFGTYNMTAIDGQPLPIVAEGLTLSGGFLTLSAEDQWGMTWSGTAQGIPMTLLEDAGTFARTGGQVTFNSSVFGDSFQGTLNGDTLVISYDVDGDGQPDAQFTFVR